MAKFTRILMCMGMLAALSFPLASCNTVEGLGEDTEAFGDTIQEGARDNRNY